MRLAICMQNRLLWIRAKAASPVLMTHAFQWNPLLEVRMQVEPVIGMTRLLQSVDPFALQAFKRLYVIRGVIQLNVPLVDLHAISTPRSLSLLSA